MDRVSDRYVHLDRERGDRAPRHGGVLGYADYGIGSNPSDRDAAASDAVGGVGRSPGLRPTVPSQSRADLGGRAPLRLGPAEGRPRDADRGRTDRRGRQSETEAVSLGRDDPRAGPVMATPFGWHVTEWIAVG